MLEMKFILFVEFPKKMKGGVFLTCADDIELFDSEGKFLFCGKFKENSKKNKKKFSSDKNKINKFKF